MGATTAGLGQPTHGFLLRDGATARSLSSTCPARREPGATCVNDAGTIVGVYTNPDATPSP
jgi:hypothetical protein